jgi:hypothetical protein
MRFRRFPAIQQSDVAPDGEFPRDIFRRVAEEAVASPSIVVMRRIVRRNLVEETILYD